MPQEENSGVSVLTVTDGSAIGLFDDRSDGGPGVAMEVGRPTGCRRVRFPLSVPWNSHGTTILGSYLPQAIRAGPRREFQSPIRGRGLRRATCVQTPIAVRAKLASGRHTPLRGRPLCPRQTPCTRFRERMQPRVVPCASARRAPMRIRLGLRRDDAVRVGAVLETGLEQPLEELPALAPEGPYRTRPHIEGLTPVGEAKSCGLAEPASSKHQ